VLLGPHLATIRELAVNAEPYLRVRWSQGGSAEWKPLWAGMATTTAERLGTYDPRDHNPNLPSTLSQLREPKGPRPAVPPNHGRP
jgi:hypothetical protein